MGPKRLPSARKAGMGREVSETTFSLSGRRLYRQKVLRCLDALGRMLDEQHFSFSHRQMGMEIELNLVDECLNPAMANTVVLEKIDNPCFTTELSQHNLELNVPPMPLAGCGTYTLEQELLDIIRTADAKARDVGAAIMMTGMLPTLRERHFNPQWLSPVHRYSLLNDEIVSARGEYMELNIEGSPLLGREPERLHCQVGNILAGSACTSVQLHLQIEPEEFAAHWNAAQCLAGVQLALGANSPFLLDRALWHETRIPVFQQAIDTRPEELRNQGVRPRVWFGERWVDSILELFEENIRYFPVLIPESDSEDPLAPLNVGKAPTLAELRLHNGTVWRWNRPVYDVSGGVAHLRIENRVLPAGPTVIDVLANAAFFYGAQRALTTDDCPLWTRMSFACAERNFYAAARHGMYAELFWPDMGWVRPDELVLQVLLPLADQGLADYGVAENARNRYLGVIEQRCRAQQNGASWQRDTVVALEAAGHSRKAALMEMLRRYMKLMRTDKPVHTWPIHW